MAAVSVLLNAPSRFWMQLESSGVFQILLELSMNAMSNSHGARPVRQIISGIKWLRTSELSIKKCLSSRSG